VAKYLKKIGEKTKENNAVFVQKSVQEKELNQKKQKKRIANCHREIHANLRKLKDR